MCCRPTAHQHDRSAARPHELLSSVSGGFHLDGHRAPTGQAAARPAGRDGHARGTAAREAVHAEVLSRCPRPRQVSDGCGFVNPLAFDNHDWDPALPWLSGEDESRWRVARWRARHSRQRLGAPVDRRPIRNACSRAVKVNRPAQSRQVRVRSVNVMDGPLRGKDRPGWKGAIRITRLPPTPTERPAPAP